MARHTVLVVDDEIKMQRILEIMLREMGLEVVRANHGQEALEIMAREPVDLILTDMRMPVMDGIALVKALHDSGSPVPVIVITAHGTIESAVSAMKLGAIDYLLRPFEVQAMELAVQRALALVKVKRENRYLRDVVAADWHDLVGDSPPMRELIASIAQVGPTNLSVLIAGETGTGKELVAHAIHRASQREGLFVAINCAGIPETLLESELFGHVRGAFTGAQGERIGKFELAQSGTLFLDEITEMPIELQTRLLRALQERAIERVGSNRRVDLDLRVIAATNREPKLAVAERRLREDVFYRLNGFRIDVPPLRVRGPDIAILARHFLAQHAQRHGKPVLALDAAAIKLIEAYRWPGNVRELDNLMGRIALLADTVPAARILGRELEIPEGAVSPPINLSDTDLRLEAQIENLERRLIHQALERAEGNKAKAARLLEISERTLWYKLKKLDLN